MQIDSGLSPDLTAAFMDSLIPFMIIGLVFYAYIATTIVIIARKTNTQHGWLAWVPFANLFLICRIARKSLVWVLVLLIPVINIIGIGVVWAGIAKARGRSGVVGALILIPLLGLLIPAYLAMGQGTATSTQGVTSGIGPDPGIGPTGSSSTTKQTVRAGSCPGCSTPANVGEIFCGNCGRKLDPGIVEESHVKFEESSHVRPPMGKKSTAGRVVGVTALIALLSVGGWWVYSSLGSHVPTGRQAPALPKRMAGTLTEFPVDTDTNQPARPGSVIAQNFQGRDILPGKTDVKVPQEWMPPGMNSRSLEGRAEALTSTQYRIPGQTDPVNVHVIEPAPGGSPGKQIAAEITRATGGKQTGVRVESPAGKVYRGSRIQTSQTVVFVLINQNSGNIVIIYAPQPAGFEVAIRLAGNAGNGGGLMDYPEIRNSLWALPHRPPDELTLVETQSFTRDDFERSLSELEFGAGNDAPELRSLVGRVRRVLPRRATVTRYVDDLSRDWHVSIGEYGTPLGSLTTWFLLRGFLGFSGIETHDVPNGDGLYANTEDGRILMLRRGTSIVFLVGPAAAALDLLQDLANSFQLE